MGDVADWVAVGLGIVQIGQAHTTGSDGVRVASGTGNYVVENHKPVRGNEISFAAFSVEVKFRGRFSTKEASAWIFYAGLFGKGDSTAPPVMANVYLYSQTVEGPWSTADDEPELILTADPMPAAVEGVGPWDPHMRFHCVLALKMPEWDNVTIDAVLDFDCEGRISVESHHFVAGRCDVEVPGPNAEAMHIVFNESHWVDTDAP